MLEKLDFQGFKMFLYRREATFNYFVYPYVHYTGFPIKDARFSKLKNILFLRSDEKEGTIVENIDFEYSSNRTSFMGNPVAPVLEALVSCCRS